MFSFVGARLAAVESYPPLLILLKTAIAVAVLFASLPARAADPTLHVPILVYHRFGPAVTDDMTVTTPVFEAQIQTLQARGHKVIPLRDLLV
ncbi:MAG: hypothetical protein K2Y40_19335 [Reyranella sp.]|nr:hypothetical protein [Reyranella sp.]